MKKVLAIFVFAVILFSLGACDFLRGIAGRPSSAQINEKRARIERAEAMKAARRDSLERARLDSVARVERYVADSLYAVDSLVHCGKLRKASSFSSISRKSLEYRCYVVAGAFSNERNAIKLAGRYADAGFESLVFKYRSGLNAVLLAPSDRISDAFEAYRRIVKLPFASKECWMLVNE